MKRRVASVVAVAAVLPIFLLGVGCGSSSSASNEAEAQQKAARQRAYRLAVQRRAVLAHQAQLQARREAVRRRANLIAARKLRAREAGERRQEAQERRELEQAEERKVEEETSPESSCDPNYSGACLQPNVSDYDCGGGSGNGPYYTGEVTVVGVDHYGLDADGDGVGCEGG